MSGQPSDTIVAQQAAKRRSFSGSKDVDKAPDNEVTIIASTSDTPVASPFKIKHCSWYGKFVRREGPIVGLLATGTAMVVLNQIIADQVRRAV